MTLIPDCNSTLTTSGCSTTTTDSPAIVLPEGTWPGIIGLLISVSLFTLVIVLLSCLILLLNRRFKSRDYYQPL